MNAWGTFTDFQALREKAYYLRHNFIEDMDKHLLKFENQANAHDIGVKWVQNEQQLIDSIIELLPNKSYNKVCFDLPNVPEVLANNTPLVTTVPLSNIQNHYDEADTLVVDADFAVVENGSLVFIDKESKDCFNSISNLIVVLNIDQMIVEQKDISLFVSLKQLNKEKCGSFSDVKIIQKPFFKIINDAFISSDSAGFSREEVKITVLLYENHVSEYLQDSFLRQSVYCVHCGRCAKVCPVVKNGGMDPISIVKNNCIDRYNKSQAIFRQTTLCGNCQCVCPVNIPLTDLLIYEMQTSVDNKSNSKDKFVFKTLSKRVKMNKYNSPFLKYFLVRAMFGKNRILLNYFSRIKDQFFNITQSNPGNADELIQ